MAFLWTRVLDVVSLGYKHKRPSKKTDVEAVHAPDAPDASDASDATHAPDTDASRVFVVCHPIQDDDDQDDANQDVAFDSARDAVVEASMRQAVDGIHRPIRAVRFVKREGVDNNGVGNEVGNGVDNNGVDNSNGVDSRFTLEELPERAKRVALEAIAAREASRRARESDLDSVADDVRERWEAIRAKLERLSATVTREKTSYAARFVTDRGMSSALVRELSDAADAKLAREHRAAKDASEQFVREAAAKRGIGNVDLASLFTAGKLTSVL